MTDQYYTRHRPRRDRTAQEHYTVTFTKAPPSRVAATPPAPTPAPFKSPEREAWDNYESIRTPETTVWREGERYPRFIMPYNSGSQRPSGTRNF